MPSFDIQASPKRGTQTGKNAKKIMERFNIVFFGADCIDCLVADREFQSKGMDRMAQHRRIRYYIRIRQNFWIVQLSPVRESEPWWLFNDLKVGQRNSSNTLFLHKGEYV